MHGAVAVAMVLLTGALAALSIARTIHGRDGGGYEWIESVEEALDHSPLLDSALQYGAAAFSGFIIMFSVGTWLSADEDNQLVEVAKIAVNGVTSAIAHLSGGLLRISHGSAVVVSLIALLCGGFALLLPIVTLRCVRPSTKEFERTALLTVVMGPVGLACLAVCPETMVFVVALETMVSFGDVDRGDDAIMSTTVSCAFFSVQYVRVALLLAYHRPSALYWALAGGTTDSIVAPLLLEALLAAAVCVFRWKMLTLVANVYPGDPIYDKLSYGIYSLFELPAVPVVALHRYLYAPMGAAADAYFGAATGSTGSSSSRSDLEAAVREHVVMEFDEKEEEQDNDEKKEEE